MSLPRFLNLSFVGNSGRLSPVRSVALLPAVLLLMLLPGCSSDSSDKDNAAAPASSAESRAAESGTAGTDTSGKGSPEKDAEKQAEKLATSDGPASLPLVEEPGLLLSEEQIRDGWIQLFDGQTLAGWTPGSEGEWSVNEGVIESGDGPPGLLLTTVPFADFELRCEYWIEEGGNSGLFLRTVEEPTDPAEDCYEFNIFDSREEYGTGSLVARAEPQEKSLGEEMWRSCSIRFEGSHLTASLDGEQVLDFVDESEHVRLSGRIGLQKRQGKVKFRNVFLKPLNTAPIFNGEDFAGWHVVPGSESEFDVEEGAIVVKDGPGFLETDESWADFVLQFDAKMRGEGLNSGVFFRLIPGTEAAPSNGYELQLENVYAEGDRSKPKDNAGTGAIFRRTQARWVIPDDREWFTTTLIAHGPRMAVWVDGFLVTDWKDTRRPDPNPRRGRRLDAGPISLQGHDPTTDLLFRNLRVAEYPEPVGMIEGLTHMGFKLDRPRAPGNIHIEKYW